MPQSLYGGRAEEWDFAEAALDPSEEAADAGLRQSLCGEL
jgi:hypothetical protein